MSNRSLQGKVLPQWITELLNSPPPPAAATEFATMNHSTGLRGKHERHSSEIVPAMLRLLLLINRVARQRRMRSTARRKAVAA